MQAAWAQVGEVEAANRQLRLAELARLLAQPVHLRQGRPRAPAAVTRPAAARVKLDGDTLTLAGQTVRSATPPAALGGAFRRRPRPTGPIARRLATTERATLARIVGTDAAYRDFTMIGAVWPDVRGIRCRDREPPAGNLPAIPAAAQVPATLRVPNRLSKIRTRRASRAKAPRSSGWIASARNNPAPGTSLDL